PGGPDEDEELAVLDLEVEAVDGGRLGARVDARGIRIGHCGHDVVLSLAGTCQTIRGKRRTRTGRGETSLRRGPALRHVRRADVAAKRVVSLTASECLCQAGGDHLSDFQGNLSNRYPHHGLSGRAAPATAPRRRRRRRCRTEAAPTTRARRPRPSRPRAPATRCARRDGRAGPPGPRAAARTTSRPRPGRTAAPGPSRAGASPAGCPRG